jgi:cytochrome c-type biogenesis protein CcmH/NrfG
MANETITDATTASTWQAKQVFAMAVICLAVGLAIGYLFRGSQSTTPPPQPGTSASNVPAGAPGSAPTSAATGHMGAGHMPSLEEMKAMADKKAAPLLEKLKTDPNNTDLLSQVGNIYKSTHQFKEALSYYEKALQIDPKNVPTRTELASCLYYTGDVDGAIAQLQTSLQHDPKDINSLFNLGMMKWQGKQDSKGALAAWQLLLKSNPQIDAAHKATVQKLIADVQMQGKS